MEIQKNSNGKYPLLFNGELVEFDHAVDANEALISKTENGISNYSVPEEGKKYTKKGRPAKPKVEKSEGEEEPEEIEAELQIEKGEPESGSRRRRPRITGMPPEEGDEA